MKRLYLSILIVLFLAVQVMAQETQTSKGTQEPTSFTLEQAVQYALENSTNIKNAALDEKIASAKVKETRGIGLPQVDGTVSIMHNEKLPRFFMQYNPDQPGFFDMSGVPGIQPGDVVAAPNFFQLPSSGSAAISVQQLIFNSSYLVGLKAANTYRELSQRQSVQTSESTIEQVTKAFYGVLINKDRIQMFDNNISRIETLFKTTSALHENGFVESIDVDRIKVTLNNLRTERDKFAALQELSLQLLKFQMNFPMDSPMEVVGAIESAQIDENVLSEYSANWDVSARSDYKLLETNKRLQELNIKNKYSASLPSLGAFANFGYSTQSPTIGGVFKTESNVEDMDQIGPDKWYPTMSFGIALNVPIFSGLQRNYQLQQEKLNLMKINNGFTALKSGIDLEIKQSAVTFLNAVKSLRSQEENRQLAENIARVTKIKYEQGVGSNMEVIDAESALKEAQTNYYTALYDALVAKTDLDKAYGRLRAPSTLEKK
jgi:outer membrane protein